MSGETPSEFGMSVSLGPAKVAQWRSRYLNDAASSGFDTMSTDQSFRGADAMSELEYNVAEQTECQKLLQDVPNKTSTRSRIGLRSPPDMNRQRRYSL